MGKITIFGSGITGMAIASQLPRGHEITIVARDLPGDPPSQQWASPWACAGWVALGGSQKEQQMQLDALAICLKLASSHPDSSCRRSEMTEVYDVGPAKAEDLWCYHRVPCFLELGVNDLSGTPKGIFQIQYTNFVLNPAIFLPWLRTQLEASGVKFKRITTIKSLGELRYLQHDVLVNASGLASLELSDVGDKKVVTDRTYTILVKSDYQKSFVRRYADEYVYIFGRQDGTAVLGGISEAVDNPERDNLSTRKHLITRAHENLPNDFPSDSPDDYEILHHMMGIRPLRLPEVRVEKETIGDQRVVHAYGTTAGGYILSFGLAREAVRLVEEFSFGL